jgi:hypothetical protein
MKVSMGLELDKELDLLRSPTKANAWAIVMYPNVLKIIMAIGFPGRKYPTINSVITLMRQVSIAQAWQKASLL